MELKAYDIRRLEHAIQRPSCTRLPHWTKVPLQTPLHLTRRGHPCPSQARGVHHHDACSRRLYGQRIIDSLPLAGPAMHALHCVPSAVFSILNFVWGALCFSKHVSPYSKSPPSPSFCAPSHNLSINNNSCPSRRSSPASVILSAAGLLSNASDCKVRFSSAPSSRSHAISRPSDNLILGPTNPSLVFRVRQAHSWLSLDSLPVQWLSWRPFNIHSRHPITSFLDRLDKSNHVRLSGREDFWSSIFI